MTTATPTIPRAANVGQRLFAGPGELCARCRAHDWAATALGPIEGWPPSLVTALGIALGAPEPALIVWGSAAICLYNEAFVDLVGPERHPVMLGASAGELWPEAWPALRAEIARVMGGGGPIRGKNPLLTLRRRGRLDEVQVSFGCGPIFDPDAPHGVGGCFVSCSELTADAPIATGSPEQEEMYRTLFEAIDEAFVLGQALFDSSGAPVDVRVLETNAAWRTMTDIEQSAVRGRLMWAEVLPDLEPFWLETCARIALGEHVRFEHYAAPVNRWMDCYGVPVGRPRDRRFAVVFRDVTQRKLAEAALRESEERQAFLLRLTDRLRRFSDPIAIQREACCLLGEQLAVNRVFYADIEGDECVFLPGYVNGVAPLPEGRRAMSSFVKSFREPLSRGEIVSSADVSADPLLDPRNVAACQALEVAAFTAVTPVEAGRWVGVLGAHSKTPRRWTEAELKLVREVADRIWAAMEHARAEAALRVSEQQVRLAMQAASMYVWTLELGTGHASYSENYADVMGFPAPEAPSTSGLITERVPPEDAADLRAALERTTRGDGDMHVQHRVRDPATGTVVWVELHATLNVDASGARVVGVAQNIDRRKRAEDALRASDERHAFLVRLGDALRPIEDARTLKAVAAEMVGRQLDVAAAGYVEVQPDEQHVFNEGEYNDGRVPSLRGWHRLSDYGEGYRDVLRSGQELCIEDAFSDQRGVPGGSAAIHAVQLRAAAVFPLIKGGRMVSAFYVMHDQPRAWPEHDRQLLRHVVERTWAAVERAQAEAALRESEARFRALVSATSDVVYRVSADWSELRSLSGAGTMFNGERSKSGWLAADIHPQDHARVREAVERAVACRSSFQLEHRVRRSDGSFGWVSSRAVPLFDDAGELKEWFGAASDVTARREAEEELKRANRAKDEFLTTLSHELRTPLTAILLWGNALRSGAVPIQELARAIEAIVQSAEGQSRLIEDLLDLSRLRSGKLLLLPSAVDVAAVARATLDTVRPMAEAKQISLEARIQDGLGCALLDAARFKQVLWNLLSNATKFTPEGGTVTLSVRRNQQHLEAEVADTGEGIAPEFLPHVFERFRQADMGETRQHMGLGIGLALIRQLLELQGGTVRAHSDGPGRGSVFRVRLPWVDPEPNQRGDRAPSSPRLLLGALKGVHVLLVEDDDNTREAMHWMLIRAGAEVVAVSSGTEALAVLGLDGQTGSGAQPPAARASRTIPDVIVTDLGMPGMSGYELLARVVSECRVRGRRPPPACAVSAHARLVDRERAIGAGFDLYVAKPVTPERLIQAVLDLRTIAAARNA